MSDMTRTCLAAYVAATVLGFSPAISAQVQVPLAERARGAERVVVGQVASVNPHWQVNEFGDRLIMSTVHVTVSETLKGEATPTVDVQVEGGTIGDVTLDVSDQVRLVPGERATFFLTRNANGRFVPRPRGEGVLKLDRSNRVPGSNLNLEQIRRGVAAGKGR